MSTQGVSSLELVVAVGDDADVVVVADGDVVVGAVEVVVAGEVVVTEVLGGGAVVVV